MSSYTHFTEEEKEQAKFEKEVTMGKLDFLYRMELLHRAVAVYIYLSDRAAVCCFS